ASLPNSIGGIGVLRSTSISFIIIWIVCTHLAQASPSLRANEALTAASEIVSQTNEIPNGFFHTFSRITCPRHHARCLAHAWLRQSVVQYILDADQDGRLFRGFYSPLASKKVE